jgi:transposase
MTRRNNYQLTEEQLSEVERAIAHDPRAEVVRRATAIRLLHLGHKPEAVAGLVSASRASVNNWHRRWREQGLEGLANRPIPGRRPKATATYREALEKALDSDPHSYGYSFSLWTLERLAEHLAHETGIRLSIGRLQHWMARWGYVYRRPKSDLSHKQDPEVREQVEQWLGEVKKQPNKGPASFSLWTKPPSA